MLSIKDWFKNENTSVYLNRIAMILLSSFLFSFSLNAFVVPHKLLSGGVSGIALLVQYVTSFKVEYTVILLNIPLFILSLKELNKEFTILTGIAIVSQSLFLVLTKDVAKYFYTKDALLSCICAGVINGFCLGTLFKNHGSLGGTDIITMIFRKKFNMGIGSMSFIMNLIIISFGGIIFGTEKALYTLIIMYITAAFIDKVIKGFNNKNLAFIVTTQSEIITELITNELRRSATVIKAKGAYTQADRMVVYCVVETKQIPKVKYIVDRADSGAFMVVLDASQVQGKGFDLPI
ncbi:YitT family protein [Clostridium sp. 19966]|uniref:YitT family protein n=1 Tax=Clostridium sp. 19966 TaxID=2768166 RepID=UPI0028DF44A8|nr:YitT family protein [Clostridium sp. 19966]MDT8715857.1 YitT family protein [Clostridium sp. 19966]